MAANLIPLIMLFQSFFALFLFTSTVVRQSSNSDSLFGSECAREGNVCNLPDNEHSLRFFILGDWGGQQHHPYTTDIQEMTAANIYNASLRLRPNFFVSTGDNFYERGVKSVDDKKFKNRTSKMDVRKVQEEELTSRKALDDVADNVSVAGLKEALTEKNKVTKCLFSSTLVFCLACACYYTYLVLLDYSQKRYTTEIKIIDRRSSLPMSNVTVCGDLSLNKTHIKNNLTIPDWILDRMTRDTGHSREEFVDQFILWIHPLVWIDAISPSLIVYFRQLIAANKHYTDFIHSASVQCGDMLKNCRFDGVEFDCCEKARTMLEPPGGVCYQITISFDMHSGQSLPLTKHQRIAGDKGGLSFEATLNLTDLLWLDDATSGGFRVYVYPYTRLCVSE